MVHRPAAARQALQADEAASSTLHFQVGDLIGRRYRLVRPLSEGGMGAVWAARDESLEVPVAVKFIRPDLTGRDGTALADRLLREARAAARLGHPAIVRMIDYGRTEREQPYLIMELLRGESLDEALDRRGRLPAIKAVRCLLPIAHALATAHAKGIVHRDLKPENVFVANTDQGRLQPKLIDFGIVKFEWKGHRRITFIGEAVGTPGYMSPEQAQGGESDFRSDIWAFCVMLYELTTGQLPFEGDNVLQLIRAIVEDDPAPITERSAGDEALWAILEQGLRKTPTRRWPSMRELGIALAEWLLDRDVSDDIAGASLESVWLQRPTRGAQDVFASIPPPNPRDPRAPLSSAPPGVLGLMTRNPTPPDGRVARPGPPPPPADSAPSSPLPAAAPSAPSTTASSAWAAPCAPAPSSPLAPTPPSTPPALAPTGQEPPSAALDSARAAPPSNARFFAVLLAITVTVIVLGSLLILRLT